MPNSIPGLHHVTAISGPPQENIDFYVACLRQRLIKRTVNFDAPDTYHLYYGDRVGTPGTIMTFFPFVDAGPGRVGTGMASAIAYRVRSGGLNAWMSRLADDGKNFDGPHERFGESVIVVADPHGLRVELIASGTTSEDGPTDIDQASVDGFHSVTLWSKHTERTVAVLTDLLGYEHVGEERDAQGRRQRVRSPAGGRGSIVDILDSDTQSIGRQGAGTVHHVAFRAETRAIQREWRERIQAFGLEVTPVIDRQYFEAIYFTEPGGTLFEIATDPPGFAIDESEDELGSHLRLPDQHEPRRASIERVLPAIRVPS